MAGARVKGLNEAIRNLQKLGIQVADLKEAFQNISRKAVSDAQALVPVRTGKLKASIRPSKAKNKAVIRAGTRAVNYASFVEFGSVHNEAESMVRDAVSNNEQYAVTQLEQELSSLIRRYNLN